LTQGLVAIVPHAVNAPLAVVVCPPLAAGVATILLERMIDASETTTDVTAIAPEALMTATEI